MVAVALLIGVEAQASNSASSGALIGRANIAVKIVSTPILRLRGEDLTATSCNGVASCVSVGSYQSGGGTQVGLVLQELGGVWHANGDLPMPAHASALVRQAYVPELASISCVSTDSCVSIANYPTPRVARASVSRPLVLTETAGRWKSSIAPIPRGVGSATETLRSISCASIHDCTIAGSLRRPAPGVKGFEAPEAIVVSNATGRWVAQLAPLPAGADHSDLEGGSSLSAVACPNSSACTAVGTYTTSSDSQQGLLLEQSANGWTSSKAPLPGRGDGVTMLDGLSCALSGECDAVGAFTIAGAPFGFMVTRHDGIWTALASPQPATYNTPYGISCVSPSSCLIAGIFLDGQYAQHGVVLAGAPGSLAVIHVPGPPGSSATPSPGFGETLSAASCIENFCEVVGTYVGAASSESGVVLTATLAPA